MRADHRRRDRGFTLVELLIVIGIISVLISILIPAISKARASAVRTQCLANIRQLVIAQTAYAADQDNYLVSAGSGTEQGSWIGLLQSYSSGPIARRCPADQSVFFDEPLPSTFPPRYRVTSYGINNYVSPTHVPFGRKPVKRFTELKRTTNVIQFVELSETGGYAGSDHIHVQDFYLAAAPQITVLKIGEQMALGRHGGSSKSMDAVLNFGFLDGHAESLAIRDVYTKPAFNLFDPLLAR